LSSWSNQAAQNTRQTLGALAAYAAPSAAEQICDQVGTSRNGHRSRTRHGVPQARLDARGRSAAARHHSTRVSSDNFSG